MLGTNAHPAARLRLMQANNLYRPILALFALLLLLQGCGGTPPRPDDTEAVKQPPSLQAQAASLIEQGEHAAAARLLEQLAASLSSPEQEQIRLDAAESWVKAGDWQAVKQILSQLPTTQLPATLIPQTQMLKAELALHQGMIDRAIDLMQPPPSADAPLPLQRRYHRNMAEAFRLSGNRLESARELSELDQLLFDEEARLANQRQLLQGLMVMTDTALTLLQPSPPGTLGGWMELARIAKANIDDPTLISTRLEAWQEDFPNHPALSQLLTGQRTESAEQLLQFDAVDHIAILLPRSGIYAKVAQAVQDGLLAAWYQQPASRRPQLRFYDSSDPDTILDSIDQAVSQGAKAIAGPLNKQALTLLLKSDGFPIPLLALNHTSNGGTPPANLYQFGLSPEGEAQLVAERAWLEGHTSALSLTPSGDWGERIAESFRTRWLTLGGVLVEQQQYQAKENDFSAPIRSLLNLDESNERRRVLQQTIHRTLEYEPRRRQDADFIFLAARPQKARQLRPQLQFHHAGQLPVYATSHIYSGAAEPEKDKDLGQILFVEIPWLLDQEDQSPLSRNQLKRLIPSIEQRYARLYALGIDAYNLLPQLPALAANTNRSLDGKTGTLYLDHKNRIHRQLAWAEMRNGRARLTGYAPRIEAPLGNEQLIELELEPGAAEQQPVTPSTPEAAVSP